MTLYNNGASVALTSRTLKDCSSALVKTGIFKVNMSKEDSKMLLASLKKDPCFTNVHRYPIKKDGVKFYEFNFVKPERWKHLETSKES